MAALDFGDSAGTFHGRVVNRGPCPIAAFEAAERKGIRREFERSIDEYLAWRDEDEAKPMEPVPGEVNVDLGSGPVHQRLSRV